MTCERKGTPGFVPDPDRGTAHLQPRSKDRPFVEMSKDGATARRRGCPRTVAVHLARLKFAWGLCEGAGVRVNHGQSSHWPKAHGPLVPCCGSRETPSDSEQMGR